MKNQNTPQLTNTGGWYDITIATYKRYLAYLESEKGKALKDNPQEVIRSTSALLSILAELPIEVINDLTPSQRENLLSTYSFLQIPHEPDTSRFSEHIYSIMNKTYFLGTFRFMIWPFDFCFPWSFGFADYITVGREVSDMKILPMIRAGCRQIPICLLSVQLIDNHTGARVLPKSTSALSLFSKIRREISIHFWWMFFVRWP